MRGLKRDDSFSSLDFSETNGFVDNSALEGLEAPRKQQRDYCQQSHCNVSFGLFGSRRIYCKACGLSFCDLHSQYTLSLKPIGYDLPQRVCNECFGKYSVLRFYKRSRSSLSLIEGYDGLKKGLSVSVKKFVQVKGEDPHIEYILSISHNGLIYEVRRRYSDFTTLMNQLKSRIEDFTHLPRNRAYRSFDPEYIQIKANNLNEWMQVIMKNNAVVVAPEFETFIAYNEALSQMTKISKNNTNSKKAVNNEMLTAPRERLDTIPGSLSSPVLSSPDSGSSPPEMVSPRKRNSLNLSVSTTKVTTLSEAVTNNLEGRLRSSSSKRSSSPIISILRRSSSGKDVSESGSVLTSPSSVNNIGFLSKRNSLSPASESKASKMSSTSSSASSTPMNFSIFSDGSSSVASTPTVIPSSGDPSPTSYVKETANSSPISSQGTDQHLKREKRRGTVPNHRGGIPMNRIQREDSVSSLRGEKVKTKNIQLRGFHFEIQDEVDTDTQESTTNTPEILSPDLQRKVLKEEGEKASLSSMKAGNKYGRFSVIGISPMQSKEEIFIFNNKVQDHRNASVSVILDYEKDEIPDPRETHFMKSIKENEIYEAEVTISSPKSPMRKISSHSPINSNAPINDIPIIKNSIELNNSQYGILSLLEEIGQKYRGEMQNYNNVIQENSMLKLENEKLYAIINEMKMKIESLENEKTRLVRAFSPSTI